MLFFRGAVIFKKYADNQIRKSRQPTVCSAVPSEARVTKHASLDLVRGLAHVQVLLKEANGI
jgi:hypothetical protein